MNETNIANQNISEDITDKVATQAAQKVSETKVKPAAKADSASRYFYGVGRRKTSTARAKYYPSADPIKVFINKKPIENYLHQFYAQVVEVALTNIGVTTGEIQIFVKGGGLSGQAEAIRLAISKSIITHNPETKPAIRNLGYITTDTRNVLPKRPGLRKARKREQWSKR